MTNSKATKKALFMSMLSLLLCFTMLMGATFAWFTDTVTSKNNKIIAGSLQVGLEMFDGTNYVDIGETSTPIFGAEDSLIAQNKNADTLWEPGKTQVAYLKIVNKGTLSLKYRVDIKVTNEAKDLYEVLQYAITPDAKNGTGVDSWNPATGVKVDDVAIAAGDSNTLTTQATEVRLDPGAEHYFALSVHMEEEATNEYQDGKVSLDIIVNATQIDAEMDSFGNDYDAGLIPPVDADDAITKTLDDGTVLKYTAEGDTVLYDTQGVVATSYTVPNGVTSLGNYSFTYTNTIEDVTLPSTVTSLGRAFDSSSTIKKVVLNEGLEQIDSRAFKSTTALEEVVISSTVKTIADNAFQKSGIKEIVIPATVATIGENAFGASLIKKVTIEGNTSIQGYAFRGCTKLSEVYLNGDDVTFVPSTLNGRNSTWFCNGESNNPNTSNITFHVKNETVAARVKTAMGAEANNTSVYVNGELYTG